MGANNAIAYSYWRRIKAGARSIDEVPDLIKDHVLAIAAEEYDWGEISQQDYERLIGKRDA